MIKAARGLTRRLDQGGGIACHWERSESDLARYAESAMTTTDTLKPNVDNRLRAGAIAFGLAALMTVPSVFSVQPPSDPAHNRECSRWEHRKFSAGDGSRDLCPHTSDSWHVRALRDHRAHAVTALGHCRTGPHRRWGWLFVARHWLCSLRGARRGYLDQPGS
jgi:hypothetical protein